MRAVTAAIEKLTDAVGRLTGWALLVMGFLVTYEVVLRYAFSMPTIWVGEVSQQIQIWTVFLAAAFVLKNRDMITIEVFLNNETSVLRRLAESFALLVLFAMTAPAIWYGIEIWLRATRAGHTTDTFLALPRWLTDAPVWLGFLLLSFQALVELRKIWTVGIPAPDDRLVDAAH